MNGMVSNKDAAEAFASLGKSRVSAGHLRYFPARAEHEFKGRSVIASYGTVIGIWLRDAPSFVAVCQHRYSSTTRRHRNLILRACEARGLKVVLVDRDQMYKLTYYNSYNSLFLDSLRHTQ